MTPHEAIEYGVILSGPILSIAGLAFAIGISASPHQHLIGKALAWPLSPIAGLLSGAIFGNALLPDWGNWGVAWMFGPGFFLTWMLAGLIAHDESIYLAGKAFSRLVPLIVRFIRDESTQGSKTIKASLKQDARSGGLHNDD